MEIEKGLDPETQQQLNVEENRRRSLWRRWPVALGAASLLAAAGLAASRFSRPKDVRWIDHAHLLHHAISSNFRVIDGVRIHYQEKGSPRGEAIILLHGFCSSNYSWKDCIEPIANAGYRVVAPDMKGFGFSDKPSDRRYGVLDQAALVVGLMKSLNIERATIVGNSYGGAIAMACALKYPELVKQIVLIDAVHDDRAVTYGLLRYLYTTFLAEMISPALFGSSRFVRRYLSNMFHDKNLVTAERFGAYLRPLRSASCQSAAITTLRQWQLRWIEKELDSIKVPTMIIWGEQDWALPVEWGASIHMAIPDSEFIVIPNCGHLPQEERPQEICNFILDFCARQRGSSAIDNVRQIKR
jgi:pimeloyl-ACP methyl ester carboxylesterase